MPKIAKELGALAVSKLATPGVHFVGGVHGLLLTITSNGGRSWLLRAMVAGKRREMGLGPFPEVTLAKARDKAREARELIRQGVDPIDRQRAAQSAVRAAAAAALTFKQCSEAYIKAHRAGWKNAKHCQQWENSLARHAHPTIGDLLVRDVGLTHVLKVLEPIWTTKTETASRLRSRMELVLDWAAARGYRDKDNPARWRGHLDKLLPAPSKVAKVVHHPALPAHEMAAFMVKLRAADGMGARALEFAILTAARSGEVRGATWYEVDKAVKAWVVPGSRMKAGREHRVPLSEAALALLAALPQGESDELLFKAPRGGQLSDMTLTAALRRMKVPAVPHGFRSTFRDWAAERTTYPNELAEMALAHTIENKAEAAYRRGDMFEKRRRMMQDWADFLARPARPTEVVNLDERRA